MGGRNKQTTMRNAGGTPTDNQTYRITLGLRRGISEKERWSLRFAVVDYRRLNKVTKRDEYSLPNPQNVFDKLQGSRYFSKLYTASAYWTIPIRPQDVEETAFHTPRGLFEMLAMPFGLFNSQATFQRLMNQALDGVANAESYVDDI